MSLHRIPNFGLFLCVSHSCNISSVYCCISYSFTTCVLLKHSLNVCEWIHESINNPLFLRAVCVCVCVCVFVCVHVKSLQSCPTLCNPMDCSPPGSSVHGILLARILEWVSMSCSFQTQGSNLHLMSPTLAGQFFTTSTTWEVLLRAELG